MGLDDALRKARADAAAATAQQASDAAIAADAMETACATILQTFRETLAHLPATHPKQILRIAPSSARFNKGRYDVVGRAWPLLESFGLGTDLTFYCRQYRYLHSISDSSIRMSTRSENVYPSNKIFDNATEALDLRRELSVRREDNFLYLHRANNGHFTILADGTILIRDCDEDSDIKLDDACANLIVAMTS